ncbi:GNAT family N-acetyltransferase [Candidatus Caldatribacterium saccharofermentans]|uniref:GNAT family N-acetyltransferase n=1 Tax=Candidatus Caldatribacterium saccharofermentans TaxID=1454753 RepID=UPI003CFBE27A
MKESGEPKTWSQSVEIRRGTFQDFEKVVELLRLVFPQDERGYYFGFLRFDPFFHPRDVWLVTDGKEVVSCLFLLRRLFSDGERLLPGGGIANVATRPDFRGRGLASLLLQEAILQSKKEGLSFLVLVTEIPAFYERFGFQDLGKFVAYLTPQEGFTLALSRVKDEEILDAYEAFYRRMELLVPFRNLGYLRGLRVWNRYSSRFREGKKVASFRKVDGVVGYFLEKETEIEVFDLFSRGNRSNLLEILQSLGKPLRLFHHPVVLRHLGVPFSRDRETVMVLYLRAFSGEVYLPVADYF